MRSHGDSEFAGVLRHEFDCFTHSDVVVKICWVPFVFFITR